MFLRKVRNLNRVYDFPLL